VMLTWIKLRSSCFVRLGIARRAQVREILGFKFAMLRLCRRQAGTDAEAVSQSMVSPDSTRTHHAVSVGVLNHLDGAHPTICLRCVQMAECNLGS